MSQSYPVARELYGIRYDLLAAPDSGQARFTFTGWFQNREIVWDMTLVTVARLLATQQQSMPPAGHTAFLEIGDETARGRAIRVALTIPNIDEPVILRTIIMIRNYKRLHPGRHEFGEPQAEN